MDCVRAFAMRQGGGGSTEAWQKFSVWAGLRTARIKYRITSEPSQTSVGRVLVASKNIVRESAISYVGVAGYCCVLMRVKC